MSDSPAPSPNPAPSPAPNPAPNATPPAADPNAWMSGFNDDMKGYIQNKGFKAPADLADSYRNLEKLQGVPQDRLLKLPESFDSPEMRAVYERLGAPKDAKGYSLEVPKEGGDSKLMEHFSNVFFEAGVPKAMAEKIVKSWNEYQGAAKTQMAESAKQAFSQSEAALKTEWGAAYDQNVNIAKEGVKVLGLSKEDIDAIASTRGHDNAMKLFHKIGQSVGEHSFVNGRPAGEQINAPEQARAQIRSLMGDSDFATRLASGDSDAKMRWDKLHKEAYPGEMGI